MVIGAVAIDGVEETGQALMTLMHTEKTVIVIHITGKTAQEALEIVWAQPGKAVGQFHPRCGLLVRVHTVIATLNTPTLGGLFANPDAR